MVNNQQQIIVWSKGESTIVARDGVDKPRWSPDGTKLAYLDHGERVIVLSYPDWSIIGDLTVDGEVIDFEWGPDSDHLALEAPMLECAWFYCQPQPETGLWVTSLTDRTLHRIAVGGTSPTWSPDGERLAYFVGYDVHVSSRTGDDTWLLHRFDGRTSVFEIEWSPSNSWIGAIVGTAGRPGPLLGLLPVNGGEVAWDDFTLWDEPIPGPTQLTWGPDGSSIAVGSARGPYVTAGHGRPLVSLGVDRFAMDVTWSADGRWLAFAGAGDDEMVEVVSTSGDRTIVPVGYGRQVHWRHAAR